MTARTATISTPDGPFTVIEDGGTVLASGWTADARTLLPQVHPTLRPAALEPVAGLGSVTDAVTAYYDGDAGPAASVPVRQFSGPFRVRAWEALRTVQPGIPVSYPGYAALAGNAAAVRAAAGACAANAAGLFVPCHRVVRTDGSAGGFRWGAAIKQSLLEREAGYFEAAG
jgi:methylated-DNA-[protein]-cysteine S-methyltransferase